LITIKSYISELSSALAEIYPADEARAVAGYYVGEILNLSNKEIILHQTNLLGIEDLAKLDAKRNDLLSGEPVQYVTGYAHFYGLKFFVDSSVLIPRQETEILVDTIIKRYKSAGKLRILDIGTGSGCIAICLKKFLSQSDVWALDISEAAIKTGKRNSEYNEAFVNFIQYDILSDKDFVSVDKFDIIISNPPYVLESEKTFMHKNVVDFEPRSALYVSDDNPLVFYERISFFAKQHLKPEGYLYFEINERFANSIIEINNENGFKSHEIIEDLNFKHRFVLSKQ
jgi:release factor glutamine methyltransferase